ncbi:hypothetical protein C7446_3287 [Kushneria sinocarnis]|uniref:Cation transporter n=1 Tax=Kushneria sinocarnis TaxID=595502 RepID=A0A420WSC7_9GAMM|nr:hypothetical protein C7446_3287 [Kushneria sinocarnis]
MKHDHRLGISSVNLVTRHLRLEPNDPEKLQAAIAEVDQLRGVDSVSFNEEKKRLDFVYDASRLCIDCVEEILIKHEVEVSHDWWTRFRQEHYRFVDQNMKDNAHHESWSCHRSSSGTNGN